MKVLQLTPRIPFPPDDGGRISMANVTRHLLDFGAGITMITLDTSAPYHQRQRIGNHEIDLYSINHSTRNTIPRIAASLFDSEPLYLRKHSSAEIQRQCFEIFQSGNYDLIHADHTAMAPLALSLKKKFGVPVGLRLHNIEWKIWQRYADELHTLDPRKWYIQSQATKLRRREKELLQQVDVAFPITAVDFEAARTMAPTTKLVLAGGGVNPEEWVETVGNIRHAHEIVLASAWSWRHNVEGAQWFINNVLPRVRESVPDASLTLVGKNIPDSLRRYGHLGVKIEGYVERMQPYYHRASVFIAPLFVGSGVRIKILEAMAAGLPVVSTTVGAEGIVVDESSGLFVTDDYRQQANTIIELMMNAERARMLGEKAQQLIAEKYSWRKQVRGMWKTYETL